MPQKISCNIVFNRPHRSYKHTFVLDFVKIYVRMAISKTSHVLLCTSISRCACLSSSCIPLYKQEICHIYDIFFPKSVHVVFNMYVNAHLNVFISITCQFKNVLCIALVVCIVCHTV